MSKLLTALILLFGSVSLAYGQNGVAKSPAALNAEINTLAQDNTTNAFTLHDLRQITLDIVASALNNINYGAASTSSFPQMPSTPAPLWATVDGGANGVAPVCMLGAGGLDLTLGHCFFASATLMGSPSGAATGEFAINGLANKPVPDINNDRLLLYDAGTNTFKQCTVGQCSSAGSSGVISIGGVVGAIALGQGLAITGTVLNTGAGIPTGQSTTVSSTYSVATTDCGKTIDATGGGYIITLGASASYPSPCRITICNDNAKAATSHATLLSGVPSGRRRLYPQQCTVFGNRNGAWQVDYDPGLYVDEGSPHFYVDNAGSDSNDGRVSAATGFATVNQCYVVLTTEYYISGLGGGNVPFCQLTAGQTFVGSGTFTQSEMWFKVGGVGTPAPIWQPTPGASYVVELGNTMGLIIQDVTLDCTGGGSSGTSGCVTLAVHQYGVVDTWTGTSFKGGTVLDGILSCDAHCRVNFSSDANTNLHWIGSTAVALNINNSSAVNFSGGLLLDPGFVATTVFQVSSNSTLNFVGGIGLGAGTNIGTLVSLTSKATACFGLVAVAVVVNPTTSFKVLNGALLANVKNLGASPPWPGLALPGGPGVFTATGFTPGSAPDASGGNTGVAAAGC